MHHEEGLQYGQSLSRHIRQDNSTDWPAGLETKATANTPATIHKAEALPHPRLGAFLENSL